ncbi:MAG: DNA polymerase III subunit delta' [Prochlorococcaceae cyanobacterium]
MSGLFANLVGQGQAVALMQAALDQGRLAPAYLLAGADGVGRRLAAKRFLEGVIAGPAGDLAIRRRLEAGNHPDLLWLEPTYQHQGQLVPVSQAEAQGVNRRALPQLRLEQVREVSRFLARRPLESPRGLVVLEAAEAMAEGAANALLKTLEEPGDGLLLLISAAPGQLLSTIRSRCQWIPFQRLDAGAMAQVMAQVMASAAMELEMEGAIEAAGASAGADSAELLELAAGSPGALLHHRRQWQALPAGLAERLLARERDPLALLGLARDLSEALDVEQQLWLLDWWQLVLWRQLRRPEPLHRLEKLRRQLRSYVQPRLAWEVCLLASATEP